jgi:ribonucleoside-diphosphate reductase alpha chain
MCIRDRSRDTLLSEASHVLLKEGKYMLPEETSPQEAFARASIAFGSNQDHAQRLYDAVSQLWFMYASPVLSNAGNPRGLPASCALTYMGDSREEIADTWKEMLFLSTLGAGVGLSMSALRSVGTGNSRGTSTPGLIPFMKVIDSITMASKQGEVRRGATAVYLDISHPEFQEFLVAREASDGGDINRKCQNIHTAVNISDEFMEAVIEGKDWQFVDPHTKQIKGSASARTIWMDILKMRMKTGEPYLHFIDASNRAMPQVMKDKGLRIHQSNLCCVTGDQRVAVKGRGLVKVIDLLGERATTFDANGEVTSKTPMTLISPSAPILRITMEGGLSHRVTHEHKILTTVGLKRADELHIGDKIELSPSGALNSSPSSFLEKAALVAGIHTGDGTGTNRSIILDLWEGKTDSMLSELEDAVAELVAGEPMNTSATPAPQFAPSLDMSGNVKFRLSSNALYRVMDNLGYQKHVVPEFVWQGNLKTVSNYLRGVYASDGHFQGSEKSGTTTIGLASIYKDLLLDIQLLLRNLGITSQVYDLGSAGAKDMPNGKGGLSSYECRASYRLYVSSRASVKLLNDLIELHKVREGSTVEWVLSEIANEPFRNKPKTSLTVTGITADGEEPVYCWEIDNDSHLWTCNGVLTHNSEITLPTAPNRTAMCFLSSLNLERFDDWKDSSIVEDMVEMLDNVIDVYIRKAPPELWKSVASAKAERSIGLGMMGFHSYLQAQNVAFEGPIAAAINRRIFKHIDERARAHSKLLAKERGEAPDMEGTGERFSFISSIAPNASSSVLCNFTSPSIEPFNANIFVQKTRRGAFILKNKHLNEVLETKYGLKGEDLEKAWDKIQEDGGSVQDLLFMDAHDKDVFKTAFELDQRWIVEHAAQRQPYISQAQSVNLFFPLDITTQVLHTVHKEAWEKGLKTLYYVRSKSASQIKRTTISTADCVACEG